MERRLRAMNKKEHVNFLVDKIRLNPIEGRVEFFDAEKRCFKPMQCQKKSSFNFIELPPLLIKSQSIRIFGSQKKI